MNFFDKNFTKEQGGFTLMEMVVVLAIFTMSSVIIANIFITLINTQRKIITQQKILSEARYAMDIMSRNIRMGTISYNDYSSIQTPYENELYLKDIDGNKNFFKLCDTTGDCVESCPADVEKCLIMSIDEGANWESITSKNIEIQDLRFYIRPTNDPFDDGSPNIQPRVSILLNIKNSSALSHYRSEIVLQSNMSTRIYNR